MNLKMLALTVPPIRRLYEHRNSLLARVEELERRKQASSRELSAGKGNMRLMH